MIKYFRRKIKELPLESKIRYSYLMVLLPVIILMIVSVAILFQENRKYDDMIDAAGSASQFSLSFKEDFDYETYLVIVESKTFEESELKQMIQEAEDVIVMLKHDTNPKSENANRLDDIDKYLHNLEVYTDRIHKNLEVGDMYDKNLEIWENDVQIVTDLIRESTIMFIYDEMQEIQRMRNEMDYLYTNIMKVFIGISILVLILIIIVTYYISRSITKPIKYLSMVTQKVSSGDLSVRANLDAGAEVGVLSDSLDVMIERINKLLVQVKEEQMILRKTELELLQSQINPHFLYNTLDTIVWLAEAGDQQKVVKMVESLSAFFRTTLNQGKDSVMIRDEIKHVNSYLEIQSVRYQDILEYSIDIPEELNEYEIPKITLQPLVENALYHGIKNKRGLGHISVTGEKKDDCILLYIEDNGIGITEDRLKQIRDKIDNTGYKDDEVFGLHNVSERIRLKYGNKYGIRIESTYGEGTKVSVVLPLEIF